jgi:SPOR domain
MPLAESLEDPKSLTEVKDDARPLASAAKLRKQVFLQFGAMVVLGLALAGWYVGFRIFSGPREERVTAPVAITVAPPLPVPAAAKPVEKTAPPLPVAAAVKPVEKTAPPLPVPAAAKPVAKTEAPLTTSAAEHKPVAVPAASTSVTKPVVAPEIIQAVKTPQPVSRKESAAQPFRRHDASLHAGDKYLQIAAFGPRALDGFLKTLEAQGRHPLVAPGPVDNIYRILVGPFPNSAALEEARRSIQASGIEPIVRTY